MIEFRKMQVEGFGSIIESTKIKLNRPGVNIVIGEIGSGKTTMFSPLRWVISGKTLKGTKDPSTWKHLRPKDYKGPSVTLFFRKDGKKFELTRAIKGRKSILTLTDSKGNNLLKDNKIKNQEYIFEFLGFNDEILVNSIIFGQRMKRLIEASGPDKKKLFEEAFNASFLKEARDSSKVDLDIEKGKLYDLEQEQAILNEKHSGKHSLYVQVKTQIDNFEAQQEESRKSLQKKLKSIDIDPDFDEKKAQKRIDLIKAKLVKEQKRYYQELSDSRVAQDNLGRAERNLKKARADKKELEAELDEIEAHTKKVNNKTCQYCGSKLNNLSQAKALKKLEKRKDAIEAKLYSTETQLLDFAAELEKLRENSKNSLLSMMDTHEDNIKNYENKISSLEKKLINQRMNKERIKSVQASLMELKHKVPPAMPKGLKEELSEIADRLARNHYVMEKLQKNIENINWVYNDLLGNKGLKSYIFDTMLAKLNSLLTHYEQFIGFRVEFRVDLDSGNKDIYTICYKDGELIFYEDLSGGQKQLVDSVTTFALYELITEDKPTNLMILDEPFEGLSESASELIYELIQDKNKGNKSIFIISHNINLQHSSDKIIRVGIEEGQTKLKIL